MVRALAVCVVLVGFVPTDAAAEWHFTPLVGLTFKGGTNIFPSEAVVDKVHPNLGGAVSLLGNGILGVEGIVVWTPGLFEDDKNVLNQVEESRGIALMGNIVLTLPRQMTEYGLRPYFSGGLGLMHATVKHPERLGGGAVFDPVHLDAGGFNLGAGVIGFFTERTGVRFDVRYYSTFRRSDDLLSSDIDSYYLRHMTASVGIVWRRR